MDVQQYLDALLKHFERKNVPLANPETYSVMVLSDRWNYMCPQSSTQLWVSTRQEESGKIKVGFSAVFPYQGKTPMLSVDLEVLGSSDAQEFFLKTISQIEITLVQKPLHYLPGFENLLSILEECFQVYLKEVNEEIKELDFDQKAQI